MKVALIQFNATADKADNCHRALRFVEEALARKAKFVALPETFLWRGNAGDKAAFAAAMEPVPGRSLLPFMAFALAHKAHILAGSVLEKARGSKKAYNTSILIGPDGTIVAKYRKIHLFDARIGDKIIREPEFFLPGRRNVLARAGEFTAGLSVCYDLRFSQLYRKYAGADIITVPSCFTRKTGEAHWEMLLRARAIENLCYVLAPGQVGPDARGVEAYGNSMIVSPWGEVLARGSDNKEEIIYGDINKQEIMKARAILPGIVKGK